MPELSSSCPSAETTNEHISRQTRTRSSNRETLVDVAIFLVSRVLRRLYFRGLKGGHQGHGVEVVVVITLDGAAGEAIITVDHRH